MSRLVVEPTGGCGLETGSLGLCANRNARIAARSDDVHARRSTLGSSINPPEHTMHPELRSFLARFIGTVLLTQIPVIFMTFVSMPLSLNRHPGEPVRTDLPLRHMT